MKTLTCLLSGILLSLSVAAADTPTFIEQPITRELFEQIRSGGFVLYMRHGNTDNSHADRFPAVDLSDCSTQRLLSDAGRQLMRDIGRHLRSAKLPLNRVLVSPMCRTRESAQLAIGEAFEISEPLMYSANMTSEQKQPRIAALKKLLAEPVKAGGNTLIIAHAPNLDDLIGFFVKPEGTIVVFRQTGNAGYEYAASIHPADWPGLLK
ncbi:histidine phosphatase family protein [Azonexus caeni]|jgi:phosphohistidine phosphatase SixA|uniref:histidine phosphatase family protein n=1 Tax=Azonexus caeni TaxID=266126 RepID=UPI003A8B9322